VAKVTEQEFFMKMLGLMAGLWICAFGLAAIVGVLEQ
jgi:hypothetical protein